MRKRFRDNVTMLRIAAALCVMLCRKATCCYTVGTGVRHSGIQEMLLQSVLVGTHLARSTKFPSSWVLDMGSARCTEHGKSMPSRTNSECAWSGQCAVSTSGGNGAVMPESCGCTR